MGKTKTVSVGGLPEEQKTGKESYEERRKKKAATAQALPAKEGQKKQVQGLGLKGGERIKVIGGDVIPEVTEVAEATESEKKKAKKVKIRSKKYQEAKQKIDRNKLYQLPDAIKLVKETSFSKFDGTIELHLVVKKTGTSARVNLPFSGGKAKKIEIADEATIDKLKKASGQEGSGPVGKIDFDILLATADMMPRLVPFAKLLGPRGLMPNPKTGTIIKTKKDAEKFSGNTLNLKTQKDAPVIHTVVGKVSQKDEELSENINAILEALGRKQIDKAYLKSTMSPSVKLQI
ncbi:MAG: hypothetical protein US60_C0044G0005 [Microgenomates group bacterium GW2011_GWC1_37_8]|uniref:Large ribosomal subunit protein uL1 n=1 Tax=Candidatus Woesebacteria bacterium GW2011_GWB1_38_8 TaxID=1618570 RepID=A0A0G0L072_9BACT|nr:MAG: hypothetical protein US60_C0044G0005 [Microgenomates group bacterium GW2011_GWC1_37_8]KKQ85343.1 MAG: 50S ribosomal protein L1 [Candidatus Woesebacteria bacterium GW2011_GWB1_38_8]